MERIIHGHATDHGEVDIGKAVGANQAGDAGMGDS